jgi:hypothetical protein
VVFSNSHTTSSSKSKFLGVVMFSKVEYGALRIEVEPTIDLEP